ncbi:MAG: SBBP repeat-containing protein [Flavobacteriales bacterium]
MNAQTFEWAKSFGGIYSNESRSVHTDKLGNVYTTGGFSGSVDFDPGVGINNLTSAGLTDVFVHKIDPSGNILWVKAFGGSYHDMGRSISLDVSGNIYTTGHFSGTVDFDPGLGITNLTSSGAGDVFVQKLDASGNFVWAKSFGGVYSDIGKSIAVDTLGNVYTAGGFDGTADFDPGLGTTNLTSSGSADVFVQKLDASGNFIWARAFGGIDYDYISSIDLDASGNVYTVGFFQLTVDFDPGAGTDNHTSAGFHDAFIQKLDGSGNFVWAKTFGSIDEEVGQSICIDISGNLYVTGYFEGMVDFDPGIGVQNRTSSGFSDIFVQKLDSSGNFIWVQSFGGTSRDYATAVATDDSGNIYATGTFLGTVDFDPGVGTTNLTSSGLNDIFVQKLDGSGNFVWAQTFGGGDNESSYSISLDGSGNVYTTGSFNGTVDFDPSQGIANLTSLGSTDIFVHKISQCVNTTFEDVITACDIYTWIDGATYTASNNTATHTLVNASGCDSVVTLNLTINSVSNISTVIVADSIIANNSNATYRWLRCDSAYTIMSNDTNQWLIPDSNGFYAVELTENGCVDTSVCIEITTVGIEDIDNGLRVNIYPNPTTGGILVSFDRELYNAELQLTNIIGEAVLHKHYDSITSTSLTLAGSSGIYFLIIKSPEGQSTFKLIKN